MGDTSPWSGDPCLCGGASGSRAGCVESLAQVFAIFTGAWCWPQAPPPPCCGYPIQANAFAGSQTSQVARLHHCLCSSPWSPPVLGGLHKPPLLLWKFLGFSPLRTSCSSLRWRVEGSGCHRLWKRSDLDTELRAGTNRLTWRAPSLTLQVASADCSGKLSTDQNVRHQVSSTSLLRQGFPLNMKSMDWQDCLANLLQGSPYLCPSSPRCGVTDPFALQYF